MGPGGNGVGGLRPVRFPEGGRPGAGKKEEEWHGTSGNGPTASMIGTPWRGIRASRPRASRSWSSSSTWSSCSPSPSRRASDLTVAGVRGGGSVARWGGGGGGMSWRGHWGGVVGGGCLGRASPWPGRGDGPPHPDDPMTGSGPCGARNRGRLGPDGLRCGLGRARGHGFSPRGRGRSSNATDGAPRRGRRSAPRHRHGGGGQAT